MKYLIALIFFTFSFSLYAELPIKTGQWEISEEVILDQEMLDQMLAQVPENMREQAMSMMKQQLGGEDRT